MLLTRPEVLAFLESVKETPEDDTPRLVLGDWLIDHGEERGEFIHLQCGLAHPGKSDPARKEMKQRERQLLLQHQERWLGPLDLLQPSQIKFRRGLLWLRCRLQNLQAVADQAESWQEFWPWVEVLGVECMPEEVEALAEMPLLRHLTGLGLDYNELNEAAANALSRSVHAAGLTHLTLAHNAIGYYTMRWLSRSQSLSRLTYLDLSHNRLDRSDATFIADSPSWKRLTYLDLSSNQIGNLGLEYLARSSNLGSLQFLGLARNSLGRDGVQQLADSPFLDRLERLDLSHNLIGTFGAQALARSAKVLDSLPRLTTLNLKDNKIGDQGAAALAQSPHLARLTRFNLANNRITDAGARALAGSPSLGKTLLDLRGNAISSRGQELLRQRFGEKVLI